MLPREFDFLRINYAQTQENNADEGDVRNPTKQIVFP